MPKDGPKKTPTGDPVKAVLITRGGSFRVETIVQNNSTDPTIRLTFPGETKARDFQPYGHLPLYKEAE